MTSKPPPSLAERALALALLLLAAAIYAYLVGRPAATARAGEKDWAPVKSETLTLVLPSEEAATPTAFRFRGPVGANVVVDVPQGVLDPSALAGVVPVPPPATCHAVPTQGQRDQKGQSRAIVEVGLKPTGARPRLTFLPSDDPNVAQLQLRAEDADLTIRMSGVAADGNNPDAWLRIDNPGGEPFQAAIAGGGALPLPVTAAAGALASISYAHVAAAGSKGPGFVFGPDGSLVVTSLWIASQPGPGAASDPIADSRLYACGAPPKDPRQWFRPADELNRIVLWGGLDRTACHPTLSVTFGPEGFTPQVRGGPAFMAVNGKANTVSWETVTSNPFLMAFLGGIPAIVGGWALKKVFAPLLFGKKQPAKRPSRSTRPPGRRGARVGGA